MQRALYTAGVGYGLQWPGPEIIGHLHQILGSLFLLGHLQLLSGELG